MRSMYTLYAHETGHNSGPGAPKEQRFYNVQKIFLIYLYNTVHEAGVAKVLETPRTAH